MTSRRPLSRTPDITRNVGDPVKTQLETERSKGPGTPMWQAPWLASLAFGGYPIIFVFGGVYPYFLGPPLEAPMCVKRGRERRGPPELYQNFLANSGRIWEQTSVWVSWPRCIETCFLLLEQEFWHKFCWPLLSQPLFKGLQMVVSKMWFEFCGGTRFHYPFLFQFYLILTSL